jgi:kinesin family member 11
MDTSLSLYISFRLWFITFHNLYLLIFTHQANSPVRHHPRALLTDANALESIEELKALVPDLVSKFRSDSKLDETDKRKQYLDQNTRTPRSPLMPVN